MNISTKQYVQDLRRYYRMPAFQVSLTLVMSLFLMAIFVVFALRPTLLSIVNLKKTIDESKKVLQQLETKVSYLQKASSQLEKLKPLVPAINASTPTSGAMYSPLTLALEEIAYQTNVVLESESLGSTLLYSRILSPFTPSKNQKIIDLPVNMKVSGTYPDVTGFLNKLLKMERIIAVDNITITKQAGTKTAAVNVTINISGNAYYMADELQLEKALAKKKGK